MKMHLLIHRLKIEKRGLIACWNAAIEKCIFKLKKYVMKALDNDWVCMALGVFQLLVTLQTLTIQISSAAGL